MKLILIAGLSRAGKSTFADFLENADLATHVPLDKYFLDVPAGYSFLEWVQHPHSIDWSLLEAHLDMLASGEPCYTPVFDPWQTGRRVSGGGKEGSSQARLMTPHQHYALPGCLAFEYAGAHDVVARVFMETAPSTIASRITGSTDDEENADDILARHLTDNFPVIKGYRAEASLVFSGEASREKKLEYLATLDDMLR